MKIAFVMHGRFEVFELAKAVADLGHEVTVIINYPEFILKKFGTGSARIISNPLHGIFLRILLFISARSCFSYPEKFMHKWFGSWAAGRIRKEYWDVVHILSGVSEEVLLLKQSGKLKGCPLIILGRLSSHIRFQKELLKREALRLNSNVELPSDWMIEREEREYDLADSIRVLSEFCANSMTKFGIKREKIFLNPSGDPEQDFSPNEADYRSRLQRIRKSDRISVLFVGSFSVRKGSAYLDLLISQVSSEKFQFRIAGPVNPDSVRIFNNMKSIENVRFLGKISQSQIPSLYADADIFVFPTLEEGYAQTLAQAKSMGIPIIASEHCQSDISVEHTKTGYIVQAGDANEIAAHLNYLESNREKFEEMAEQAYTKRSGRSWRDSAEEFDRFIRRRIVR